MTLLELAAALRKTADAMYHANGERRAKHPLVARLLRQRDIDTLMGAARIIEAWAEEFEEVEPS